MSQDFPINNITFCIRGIYNGHLWITSILFSFTGRGQEGGNIISLFDFLEFSLSRTCWLNSCYFCNFTRRFSNNMSTACENEEKPATCQAKPDTEEEEDLDALLDDALNDFDAKPKSEETPPPTKTKPVSTNNNDTKDGQQNHGDNLTELTSDLTDVLEKMVMSEPSLKSHFETFQQKTSAAANLQPNPEQFDFDDENILKSFEEFTKSMGEGGGAGGFGGLGGAPGAPEDMDELLKSFQEEFGGVGGGGEGGEGGFMGMMQGMMESLLNKDLLYPSLKEIRDKYPAWFDENSTKISVEDLDKYKKQQTIICQLCELFEKEREDDAESVKKERTLRVVALMEEMQAYGHPPPDMMENIVCGDAGMFGGAGAAPPGAPECCVM